VALEGYCAVTLCEKRSWTPGDVRYGAIHRGRTYLFQSPAEQQRFLANPDRYSPVISGNDPVVALDEGRAVPGTRRYGLFYENRVYLFSSEESLARFSRAPNRYAAEIIQAMR
jgi:YHS domain-containing protein